MIWKAPSGLLYLRTNMLLEAGDQFEHEGTWYRVKDDSAASEWVEELGQLAHWYIVEQVQGAAQ